jgi:hypothetical protein
MIVGPPEIGPLYSPPTSPVPPHRHQTMRKFILIEHSLRDLGGHYYTYAYSILKAAERAGFQPVIAVNSAFQDLPSLPSHWQVHALYPHKSYWLPAYGSQPVRPAAAGFINRGWRNLQNRLVRQKRKRLAKRFFFATQKLFRQLSLQQGDHVLVATASDIDLLGLCRFLNQTPDTLVADWHVQFHHPIFYGREPDYPAQRDTREAVRQAFTEALATIPDHRIHLHCTTDQLTAQYEYLGVARFRTLPYAIHSLFGVPQAIEKPALPARIACLGHTRMEKGYGQLPLLIRELWADYLGSGRAQLLLQTRRESLRKRLSALIMDLGAAPATSPLTYASFPLSLEAYAALVQSVDVALLLYDAQRYYARCSGILLEALICGAPVVVPAGSWMHEQIAPENQRYLQRLSQGDLGFKSASSGQMQNPEISSEGLQFNRQAVVSQFEIASGHRALLLEFRWLSPTSPGIYIRLTLDQLSDSGAVQDSFSVVAGSHCSDGRVRVLFRLKPLSTRLRLTWQNAWSNDTIHLEDIDYKLFVEDGIPLASIGVVAADSDQLVTSLAEVLDHLEHYQERANAFAAPYALIHSAANVVRQMTETQG